MVSLIITLTMGVCSNYHGYFFQCEKTNDQLNL